MGTPSPVPAGPGNAPLTHQIKRFLRDGNVWSIINQHICVVPRPRFPGLRTNGRGCPPAHSWNVCLSRPVAILALPSPAPAHSTRVCPRSDRSPHPLLASRDHSSHGSQLPELAQEELTLHRAPADDVLRHLRHREEKVPWLKVTRGSPCLSSSSKPPSPSLSCCLWAPPGWGLNPIPTLNHPGHSLCHCSGEADGETEARGQPGALPSSPGPGLTVAT